MWTYKYKRSDSPSQPSLYSVPVSTLVIANTVDEANNRLRLVTITMTFHDGTCSVSSYSVSVDSPFQVRNTEDHAVFMP